jgi:hypothetical protein
MGQSTDITNDRPRQARHGETWQEHWQRRMRHAYPGDIPVRGGNVVRSGDARRGDQAEPAQRQGPTLLDRDQRLIDKRR